MNLMMFSIHDLWWVVYDYKCFRMCCIDDVLWLLTVIDELYA